MKPPKLGATGQFPQGKLGPHDEGELQIGLSVREGCVVIAFGKEVAWIGMDPSLAEQLGRKILQAAQRARMGRVQ